MFLQKVKDTVQVDYNVSRHLGDELNRTDWNLLVINVLLVVNNFSPTCFLSLQSMSQLLIVVIVQHSNTHKYIDNIMVISRH